MKSLPLWDLLGLRQVWLDGGCDTTGLFLMVLMVSTSPLFLKQKQQYNITEVLL